VKEDAKMLAMMDLRENDRELTKDVKFIKWG